MSDEPAWELRFRAPRVTLPIDAELAPTRSVFRSNETGVWEVYAWNRATGERRQVTRRPEGTWLATISPDGGWVWWFADTDGDEFGHWVREPFAGGAAEPVAPGLPDAYPAGLAFVVAGERAGEVVLGQATDAGPRIWRLRPGTGERTLLYQHAEDAGVAAVSHDGALVALEHSEHGDSRHPALRVLSADDGAPVGELWDGPGRGVAALGFPELAGDSRLLVQHERRGRSELLIWHVGTGEQAELPIDLPGELDASWYPDGRSLLVSSDFRGRTTLHRYDLQSGRLSPLPSPPGVVTAATVRRDGTVEYAASSSQRPPRVLDLDGREVLTARGVRAPENVPAEELAVPSPHGEIPVFLSRPREAPPRPAAVFLVHGGPTAHDADAFSPDVGALVDAGYTVVQVNYRGSDGYGTAWRDAIEAGAGAGPGRSEVEDLLAVRSFLADTHRVDPARVALVGASWGGYLTLLGLGLAPDAWAAGVAEVPVADYVAAFEDEMEPLQAFDRALFGGSPTDVPERYAAASPITYVDRVRAPLLVLAGENDPRCPLRQIENYLARLRELGVPHAVYRFDAGHGSLRVDETIRQVRAILAFLRRHLPTGGEPVTSAAQPSG